VSIIRSFSLYTQQWYMSYRFADSLLASCQQTCMTYSIAVCTVKNSWWWTQELSEICRFYSKNKFEKLLHIYLVLLWEYDIRINRMFLQYTWALWLYMYLLPTQTFDFVMARKIMNLMVVFRTMLPVELVSLLGLTPCWVSSSLTFWWIIVP